MRAAVGAEARFEADGRVAGHASLFGVPDTAGDVVERGAFAASLRQRGADGVRMLWQHDPAEPIGAWSTVREDATGLFVEGRLALETRRGREALALIRAGAIDGLSIGFRARAARRSAGAKGRRLLAIDLWEVSIVTFPCQERARLRALPVSADAADDAALARRIEAARRRILNPTRSQPERA
ncbi:HK97 family phage prohead protease [Antarcticirhabdus aurantiaca]|uniref:HK97 family phage prohead protease n=1 Tax=Antarcticirhabdus aurantiaca TaxID=2606717 RepID=A0ACD4NIT8_9HYPH|nr:HK97 family phage prohead protease [Antarcticirhabdus aurantiaca]WAJ26702.1 HK97 family phage prohead protease [Jeongeuplla avenae]